MFVPVFATGRAETPDSGMAIDQAGGRVITDGIGIKPAPNGIHRQHLDPSGLSHASAVIFRRAEEIVKVF